MFQSARCTQDFNFLVVWKSPSHVHNFHSKSKRSAGPSLMSGGSQIKDFE